VGVLAPAASAASFSYDAGTQVLRLTGASGEEVTIESPGDGGGGPQYLVSASLGGVSTAWTGTNRAGLLAYSVPLSPPQHGLTIQPDVAGGLPLARIEVVDDTGPVNVILAGGKDSDDNPIPYADPIEISLTNASSTARVYDAEHDPVSMGTTSLLVNAPEVRLQDDIAAAGSITLVSANPIKLLKSGVGTPTVSLTASTLVSTTAIVGNATGTANALHVQGPWRAGTVTAAQSIAVTGTTRLFGNLTASGDVDLDAVEVGGHGVLRTITSPSITVGAVTGGFSACGGQPDVIGMCNVDALAPAAGGVITFDGDVTIAGEVRDINTLEVTGATRLWGDITSPAGTATFNGALTLGGSATRRITTAVLHTLGGLGQDLAPCGGSGISACAGMGVLAPPVPTTAVVVDALWVNALTAYMPVSITALQRVLTPVTGTRTSSIQSGGTLDLSGGVAVNDGGSLILAGAPTILAGVAPGANAGSVGPSVDSGPCTPGPLQVIGDWRLTAPIECLSTLATADGTTTLGADVTTQARQSYGGPVVLAVGTGTRTLAAGGGTDVAFNGGSVSAAWDPAGGDVESYTATLAPYGHRCTAPGSATTCSFGGVGPAPVVTADVSTTRPAAKPGAGSEATTRPGPTARGTTRRVARGSRTRLTALISPPASRGTRRWSESGPCTIAGARLVAPRRRATCMLTLRVARYRGTPAWSGRATVIVR
jgi:hypothetical protein